MNGQNSWKMTWVLGLVVIGGCGGGQTASLTDNSSCAQFVAASSKEQAAYIGTLTGLDLSVINPDQSYTNRNEADGVIEQMCETTPSSRLGDVVGQLDGTQE
jgi:hypothetical protein